MSNKIEKVFGLTPMPITQPSDDGIKSVQDYEQAETDFTVARESNFEALEIAKGAVEDMAVIAKQSQHPKAYEALNAILKTYADIATNTVDLQLKKKRLQPKDSGLPDQIVNNNLFVGSTAELQQMIEDAKKAKAEEKGDE